MDSARGDHVMGTGKDSRDRFGQVIIPYAGIYEERKKEFLPTAFRTTPNDIMISM